MENSGNKARGSDELDFSQVFNAIGKFFSRIGNSILFFLATLRNLFFSNRLFFAGLILIGLLLGGVYSEILKKKFYQTTMVISCDYLNTQILDNTIQKLNNLAEERDGEGLADVLRIDVDAAKNVLEFEFKPFVSEDDVVEMEVLRAQLNTVAADKREIVDKVISKLQIENKNAYQIIVRVFDPATVKTLEKAIVNYFRSSPYIQKRIEINKENLVRRKHKLSSDGRKLDSLKQIIYENYQTIGKTSRGSNNVILSDEQLANPLEVFKQGLEVNRELLEVEESLYINPDFEVVDGFTTFKEPESASLFKILLISLFLSILIGYLIIGAWKFDAMLAKIDTKSK